MNIFPVDKTSVLWCEFIMALPFRLSTKKNISVVHSYSNELVNELNKKVFAEASKFVLLSK